MTTYNPRASSVLMMTCERTARSMISVYSYSICGVMKPGEIGQQSVDRASLRGCGPPLSECRERFGFRGHRHSILPNWWPAPLVTGLAVARLEEQGCMRLLPEAQPA